MPGTEDEKLCTKCGEVKQLVEFNRRAASLDGRQHWCRLCQKARHMETRKDEGVLRREQEYRDARKGENAARARKWHRENRERAHAQGVKYRNENRDRLNADKRRYYAENKPRHAANAVRWRKSNPGGKLAHVHLQRAIERGQITPRSCTVCGSADGVEGHHWDYSKPLDVTWLCRSCHRRVHRGIHAKELCERLGHPGWEMP